MLNHADFRSPQTRPVFPEQADDAHPRCREMAEAMRELFSVGGGVRSKDLIGAGFTWAEIAEFSDAAAKLAYDASVRHLTSRPDLLADIIEKARAPLPNRPPLPRDTKETQARLVDWGRYCAARAALVLDPWPGQRERCLNLLSLYLNRLPIFPANRETVMRTVEQTLPQVAQ
ncbi:hypothetical protein [Mesorhizobium sp.]|uniref:hypothetical protein n=1 Tax=Mesorhizobium sp. TaxID=1871066 RepID=UPI000FD45948|nr:hypothetical protein [Mesorhizobium sp.]RUV98280.1 hypothetical protein EOA88_00120 [Mesorhizobium sp. M5C.F.Ca.IN.020.14.1.1]RWJ00539.1 MAG: hypothetical protein EOR23_28480 [Mesorhizobium sp.]TJW57500.1 MAG: hypothetical protein E5X59_00860 [Mesorhizobium sp.]